MLPKLNSGIGPDLRLTHPMGDGARAVGAVTIGDLAIIGASSIVTRDTHSNNTSVGIPGRIISEQNLRRNEAP